MSRICFNMQVSVLPMSMPSESKFALHLSNVSIIIIIFIVDKSPVHNEK